MYSVLNTYTYSAYSVLNTYTYSMYSVLNTYTYSVYSVLNIYTYSVYSVLNTYIYSVYNVLNTYTYSMYSVLIYYTSMSLICFTCLPQLKHTHTFSLDIKILSLSLRQIGNYQTHHISFSLFVWYAIFPHISLQSHTVQRHFFTSLFSRRISYVFFFFCEPRGSVGGSDGTLQGLYSETTSP